MATWETPQGKASRGSDRERAGKLMAETEDELARLVANGPSPYSSLSQYQKADMLFRALRRLQELQSPQC